MTGNRFHAIYALTPMREQSGSWRIAGYSIEETAPQAGQITWGGDLYA
jgi:hypothetical protein